MGNSFVWYELMTTDVEVAKTFYSHVIGWETEAFEAGNPDYTIIKAGDRGVGGIMPMPQDACEAGASPHWLGYVAVTDVDEAARRISEAGGTLHKAPFDIPGAGRMAPVSDPQGVGFMLIAPSGEDEPPAPPMTPGHVGWHELHSTDWEAGFRFYADQFGWQKTEALDMGPMGTYQLFSDGGENAIGGMMNMIHSPRPHWLYYFVVADFDAAVDRIRSGGGQIVDGPMEVPGGAWVVQAKDPQNGIFAIVGMRG